MALMSQVAVLAKMAEVAQMCGVTETVEILDGITGMDSVDCKRAYMEWHQPPGAQVRKGKCGSQTGGCLLVGVVG